jgi:hypothetical protein
MPVKSLLTPFERVQARVEIEGKHWLCHGATTKQGYPTMNVDGRVTTCSRVVLAHVLGRPIKQHHSAAAACGRINCVSPACLKERSRSQQSAKSSPGRKFTPAGKESLRRAARERGLCKLCPVTAKQLRAQQKEGATYRELSERFGVSLSTAYRAAIGRTWPEAAPNSSVFAWRPAA